MTDGEIRALMDGATPGPWEWNVHGEVGFSSKEDDQSFGMICDVIAECNWPNASNNARLIASAPDLAAECLRRGEENDRLRAALTIISRSVIDRDDGKWIPSHNAEIAIRALEKTK